MRAYPEMQMMVAGLAGGLAVEMKAMLRPAGVPPGSRVLRCGWTRITWTCVPIVRDWRRRVLRRLASGGRRGAGQPAGGRGWNDGRLWSI